MGRKAKKKMAMGWQLRPDQTGKQMVDLIFQSGTDANGVKIIKPPVFIELVKAVR